MSFYNCDKCEKYKDDIKILNKKIKNYENAMTNLLKSNDIDTVSQTPIYKPPNYEYFDEDRETNEDIKIKKDSNGDYEKIIENNFGKDYSYIESLEDIQCISKTELQSINMQDNLKKYHSIKKKYNNMSGWGKSIYNFGRFFI